MSDKTIIVVDDQAHMLRLLDYTLGKTGCRILTARDGQSAIALVQEERVDLLVVDVVMPGLDGFETVRRIRQNPAYAGLPVIMLTARGQSETRIEARELAIDVFLTKPFSPIELTAHARRLLLLEPPAGEPAAPANPPPPRGAGPA